MIERPNSDSDIEVNRNCSDLKQDVGNKTLLRPTNCIVLTFP